MTTFNQNQNQVENASNTNTATPRRVEEKVVIDPLVRRWLKEYIIIEKGEGSNFDLQANQILFYLGESFLCKYHLFLRQFLDLLKMIYRQ